MDIISLQSLDQQSIVQFLRAKKGFPSEVLIGATLKEPICAGDDKKAAAILSKVARHLSSQDRVLTAVILDAHTETPRWGGIRNPVDWSSHVSVDRCSKSYSTFNDRVQNILESYSTNQFNINDTSAPLWKIVLIRGNQSHEPDSLLFILCHIVGDGKTCKTLFTRSMDLLYKYLDADTTGKEPLLTVNQDGTLPIQHTTALPPPFESFNDTTVPLVGILSMYFFSFLLSAYCPNWVYNLLPHNKIYYSLNQEKFKNFTPSLDCGHRVMTIPSLYSLSKSPKLDSPVSVNSILGRLFDVALYGTSMHFKKLSGNTTSAGAGDPLFFVTNSMMCLNTLDGTPLGNYTGAGKYQEVLYSHTKFWETVNKFYYFMRSEQCLKEATYSGYLVHCCGGASRLMDNMYTRAGRFMQTFGQPIVSNMGAFLDNKSNNHNLGSKVENVFVFHNAMPFLQPITNYVTSLDKTSSISVIFSWRKDSVSEEWVDYYEKTLRLITNKILNEEAPDLSLTIGSMVSQNAN